MRHIDTRVAGRALDAVSPKEAAQVDRHVRRCQACHQALRAAQETAHLLTLVVPPARPPHHCKARVLERIAWDDVRLRGARSHHHVLRWTGWALALLLGAWSVHRLCTRQAQRRVGAA